MRSPPPCATSCVGLASIRLRPGSDAIEAASGKIVQQRLIIELGIVAAQRELESVLAFRRAVARARRAADLVQDRRHIAQEGHLIGRLRA